MNTEPTVPVDEPSAPEPIHLDSDEWLRIAEGMELGSVCDLLRRESECK